MTTDSKDLCALDAHSIAKLVRERKVSPVDVVEAFLARQERLDAQLHAFCTPTPQLARATAKRLQADLDAGKPVGPMAGVPIAIKDLISTKGIKTAGGSKPYAHFVPEEDDIVVERLVAADAIVVGKTNVAELGYGAVGHNPVFETTRNPWALELTSGGSSAGSAAAVATAMAPVALGSDGGGSIRIPAALCGIFGFKASMGRVPLYPGCRDERYPGFSGWESIEHIGPLARTVRDIALVMSVIAGPDPRDRLSIPCRDVNWFDAANGAVLRLRIAYSSNWGFAPVDPEVRDVARAAAQLFEKHYGCEVDEVHPGFGPEAADHFEALVAMETDIEGMRRMVEADPEAFSPHIVAMVQKQWTGTEFTNAIMARKRVNNAMWRLMSKYDLLLTPTVASPAFALGIGGPPTIDGIAVPPQGWTPFTYVMNLTGQPAISVPAGFTKAGLPVGLQICGPHLGDALVLRAASAFEAVAPWARNFPPIAAL